MFQDSVLKTFYDLIEVFHMKQNVLSDKVVSLRNEFVEIEISQEEGEVYLRLRTSSEAENAQVIDPLIWGISKGVLKVSEVFPSSFPSTLNHEEELDFRLLELKLLIKYFCFDLLIGETKSISDYRENEERIRKEVNSEIISKYSTMKSWPY